MKNKLIKTDDEIQKIIASSKLLFKVKNKIKEHIKPGITTLDLDEIAHKYMKELKVIPSFLNYHGFPNVICASVNETLIHGIPNNTPLKEGDLLSIDVGIMWKEFHSDSAFTISVGDEHNTENERLIGIAKEAFYAGVDAIKPGVRTGDIGAAIYKVTKRYNVYVPENFAGHGIGKKLHEDPFILNYGSKNKGDLLYNNMVICIEPMIMQGSDKIEILQDNWTVNCKSKQKSSHYEHTILIKDGKGIVLTGGINE